MSYVRHPGVAAVLSFVFNGLGQLYNGQLAKGLAIVFVSAVGMLVLLCGAVFTGFWLVGKVVFAAQLAVGLFLFAAGLVVICAAAIYSIVDAYRVALRK